MKLAEALIIRGDLQKHLDELKVRLLRSAKIQEGEEPPENPKELLQELNHYTDELINIVQKIYKCNATVVIDGIGTITDALAKRDILMLKRNILSALLDEAAERQHRYSGSEIKILASVNVGEIQKQMDDLSAEYRLLDTKIQEKNWLVDLD